MDYQVKISIEPYDGELRQVGNTFSFESAEIVAEILSKKREKLGLEVGKFFQQTQEPERKDTKECRGCGRIISKYSPECNEPIPDGDFYEKEPECDWCGYLGMVKQGEQCQKCRKPLEKPAKKECEHKGFVIGCADCEYEVMKQPLKKDELAERLSHVLYDCMDEPVVKHLADEARKWACEVVEKAFRDSAECYEGVLLDEVLERLKEGMK